MEAIAVVSILVSVFTMIAAAGLANKVKKLTLRLLVAELCIVKMVKLHETQSETIKLFAEASPLIKQMSEIMAAEITRAKTGVRPN